MKKIVFVFIIFIFISHSCVIKRCKDRQCTVRMVHYHNGDEYRGVNLFTYLFKNKNPRYGWGYPNLVKEPNAVPNADKNGYEIHSKANLKVIKPKPKKEEPNIENTVEEKKTETPTNQATTPSENKVDPVSK